MTTSTTPLQSPARRFSSPLTQQSTYSDRFIPSRLSSNLEDAFDQFRDDSNGDKLNETNDGGYESMGTMNNLLRCELLGQSQGYMKRDGMNSLNNSVDSPRNITSRNSSNVLKYTSTTRNRSSGSSPSSSLESVQQHFIPASSGTQRIQNSPKKVSRKISRIPYKILDAPQLQDDYYLNLVDWSSSNVLAVALRSSVYLWSASTSKVGVWYLHMFQHCFQYLISLVRGNHVL